MPKKVQKEKAPKAEKPAKAKKNHAEQEAIEKAHAAKNARLNATIFKFTGTEPTMKLAPQAQGIVNIIKEAKQITRADLVTAMDGVITTRQPMGRILSYYQKTIVDCGSVEIVEPVSGEAPAN